MRKETPETQRLCSRIIDMRTRVLCMKGVEGVEGISDDLQKGLKELPLPSRKTTLEKE